MTCAVTLVDSPHAVGSQEHRPPMPDSHTRTDTLNLIIVPTLSKNTSVRLPLNKVSHCTSSWPGARFGGDVHIGTRVSEACKRCRAVLLRVMHLVNSQPAVVHLSTGAGAGVTLLDNWCSCWQEHRERLTDRAMRTDQCRPMLPDALTGCISRSTRRLFILKVRLFAPTLGLCTGS